METHKPPVFGKVIMLSDAFGRRFYYLRLSITDVCNFRCNYCLPDGYVANGSRQFLNQAEIKRITTAFAKLGTEKVRITGGEPSLRKDLPDIIAATKSTPGIKKVAITTNGFKLTQHLPAWVDAGLDSLNISIDSLDPRQFHAITGHNKLDELLKGLSLAATLGLKDIKVNTVLMRQFNFKELETFFAWVKHTPITLRFIELMETGDNKRFFDEQHVSGLSIKEQLLENGWSQFIRDKAAGPAQEFSHPDYAGNVGLIMPYGKDFCQSCNRLRISALGKLHLCLFAEAGANLRDYLQEDNDPRLIDTIVRLLGDKKSSHYLTEGFTGATKQLSMLGG